MLAKWFTRRHGTTPRPEPSRERDAALAAASSSKPEPAPPAQGSWLVVRRPLIDRTGGIAGWDLQLSARARDRLARPDAPRVLREAYFFALVQAARETVEESRRVIVGLPDEAAADLSLLDQLPGRTIIRVGATQSAHLAQRDPGWTSRIEARGLLVAAALAPDAPQRCAYNLLDGDHTDFGTRFSLPAGQRTIAMNLPTYEAVGEAVRRGVEFCCGNFIVAAKRPESTLVAPVVVNAANILSAIIAGRSARDIAGQFKLDTALSHRLLQATRSAAFALHRPLESIQEAVMMLGVRELYRWLSVLLMSADSRSTIATALHETALARGRLLELLAETSPRGDPPEQLFVTGTFSLLDLILGVPLDVALALAPVPEAASEALIAESGPWRPYVQIALALERDDPVSLEAASHALSIDVDAALRLSRDAHAWAAQTIALLRNETPEKVEAPV